MKTTFKPYQLVEVFVKAEVEQGTYSYIGEVLSFETPERTIMVRRVPGHPGTLDEVQMEQLKVIHPTLKRVRISYARVGGSGSFPLDMLRYDSCVPVNFKLVPHERLTHRLIPQIDPAFGWADAVVARVTPVNLRSGFTTARWSSFLWGCKELKTETYAGGN